MHLHQIDSPSDIRLASYGQLSGLAKEIRQEIITTVSENGGHLASNLGVVELTIALHRMFNAPADQIIFDVGHQSYVHKLLTGRYAAFSTLRKKDGISGFPKRCESEYDCFETGHSSTAISAALGMARARDLKGLDHHVIAVVGDGALTGGMCYEALNDAGSSGTPIIVILNDNEMSISKNVGALSRHLTNLRVSRGWNQVKNAVKRGLRRLPLLGKPLYRLLGWAKDSIKGLMVDEGFFTSLGFRYIGPVDGHDLPNLEYVLSRAKEIQEPVLIHCITKKGYGYEWAESQPEAFHGTPPFFVENGEARKVRSAPSMGAVAGECLVKMAAQDEHIVAITAAMPLGTGLSAFEKAYPNRLFDVGIAEEHAVTMAAGLAAGGMRPYFAVYSSFLQRGYDQVLHDVCLQNLPVTFLIDRAGLGGDDGPTHHGVFDITYLRHIPNLTLLSPMDDIELREMMALSIKMEGPCAIRYPRAMVSLNLPEARKSFQLGRWQLLREGGHFAILATGTMVRVALEAAALLEERHGILAAVVNASTIKPLDGEMIAALSGRRMITLEEHALAGGFGSAVTEYCVEQGLMPPAAILGIPDAFVPHGHFRELLESLGLDAPHVADVVVDLMKDKKGEEPHHG